jgi:hypothetical protein
VLRRITGQTIAVKAELVGGPPPTQQAKPADSQSSRPTDRRKQLMELPLFRKAGEVLGAQLWHLDEGFNPTVARPTTPAAAIAEDDETPPAEPDPDEG